ncbi:MAG: hypothetical protein ACI4UE_00340 [Candidatus Scatovivens sp.]
MSNNITQKLKYKESIVKFSYKYGVTKASIKFCECKKTIYRWRERYKGSLEELRNRRTDCFKILYNKISQQSECTCK